MKLNLKFKILLTIMSLLIIATGTNIYYSTRTFVDDKKAYLFDSLLSKAEISTDRLNNELFEISNFSLEQSQRSGQKLKTNYLASFSYDNNFSNPQVIFLNKSSTYFNEEIINAIKDENDYVRKSLLQTTSVPLRLMKIQKWTIFAKIERQEGNFKVLFFSSHPIAELINSQSQDSGQFIWLDYHQKSLPHLGKELLNSQMITDTQNSKITKLTKEIDHKEPNKGTSLVAVTKSKVFPFLLALGIEKSKAFQVTKDLALKTVLFALFLFGIFAIFGLLLSGQLTTPILELTEAAKNVAVGNFNYKESIKTQDELKLLGQTFEYMCTEIKDLLGQKEQMINELAQANEKLDEYNKNLELMVQERTQQLNEANTFMSAMINSLDQGLVVFDSELKIKPIFTKASERLFRHSPQNKTFSEILGKNEEEANTLNQWAQITFNGVIPFESAIGLAPDHISFGEKIDDKNFQYIALNYYPMLNKDNQEKLDNIVAVATDKTERLKAEHQFKKQEAYVQMVLKILKNKNAFSNFISEVQRIFENFKNCYNEDDNTINTELAMMLFHTLNGGFGLFRLFELRELARENEQFIIDNQKSFQDNITQFAYELAKRVRNLEIQFNLKLQELDTNLDTQFSSKKTSVEIEESSILEFYQNLLVFKDELANKNELKQIIQSQINDFEDKFIKKPIKEFIIPYEELCQKTAEKLGKKIAPITYFNEHYKVHPEKFQEFFNVLIHLFRNCLDHGIELPHVRQELGKDETGKIAIGLEALEDEQVIITIEDDGKGIDPQKIRSKMLDLVPEYTLELESDKEVIYHIFDPFFSTTTEVTELSGRGVGMSAIKEVVEKMKGSIEIESHLNKGTKFIFTLPL